MYQLLSIRLDVGVCLNNAGVGVLELRVLADQGDLHKLAQVLSTVCQLTPSGNELPKHIEV